MASRLATEFYGTFMLVLTIYLTVSQSKPMFALAIGTVLSVMVYMGGHVSGANYNPAVTFGLLVSGRPGSTGIANAKEMIMYWGAQLFGAIAAAGIGYGLAPEGSFAPDFGGEADNGSMKAFACEFLFTFALVLVVLNTATCERTSANNAFNGFAIGSTVFVGVTAAGAYSGGCFNPAVATGLIFNHGVFAASEIVNPFGIVGYWAAELLAAAAAAMVFRFTVPSEYKKC